MNSSFRQEEKGSVFYNLKLNVRGLKDTHSTPITFRNTRTDNILDKASDYELAVVRFKLPNTEIPLMRFFPDKEEYKQSLTNYFIDYKFILSYNGDDYVSDPLEDDVLWCFTYTAILDVINSFIKSAFDKLQSAYPADPIISNLKIPIITYGSFFNNNGVFPFEIDQGFQIAGIDFFMNEDLLYLFQYDILPLGKSYNELDTNRLQLNIPQKDIPVLGSLTFIDQSIDTRIYLDQLASIQFFTSKIPVRAELEQKSGVGQSVITDFEPPQVIGRGGYYQFFPQGPLRWLSLDSNEPLRDIDVYIRWTSVLGDSNVLEAPVNSVANIKLEFRKRSDKYIID